MISVICFIVFIIILTLGCIIKKVRRPKSVSWGFLWLVIYNDLMTFLCFLSISMPSPGYDSSTQNPRAGYMPGEFLVLSGFPLLIIGFFLKLIYYCTNQEIVDADNEQEEIKGFKKWLKRSVGSIIYIIISIFPAGFTFMMILSRLPHIRMLAILGVWSMILLPIILPFAPRLYALRHIIFNSQRRLAKMEVKKNHKHKKVFLPILIVFLALLLFSIVFLINYFNTPNVTPIEATSTLEDAITPPSKEAEKSPVVEDALIDNPLPNIITDKYIFLCPEEWKEKISIKYSDDTKGVIIYHNCSPECCESAYPQELMRIVTLTTKELEEEKASFEFLGQFPETRIVLQTSEFAIMCFPSLTNDHTIEKYSDELSEMGELRPTIHTFFSLRN